MIEILGVSGHRPPRLIAGGFDRGHWVSRAMSGIDALKPKFMVIGFALGWDLACAEAALRAGIPYTAAIPFPEQPAVWWSAEDRQDYARLLARAHNVVYVSQGPYAPYKLLKRNEWINDHSQGLMAMFDGQPRGGTFHCIQDARAKGRPVHNMWDYPLAS